MLGSKSAIFLGVGKGSHSVELGPADKFLQLLKFRLAFAWKSHHQRGSDVDARHFTSQLLDELVGVFLIDIASHVGKDAGADVLKRDVEILADVLLLSHHSEQVHREVLGIGIVQTYPFHSLNVSHPFNEFRNLLLAVEVDAVVGEFLCNDLKLFHSLSHQVLHFCQNLLHWARMVLARGNRNGTVGTLAVASFRNLQVSIVLGSRDAALVCSTSIVSLSQVIEQLCPVELSIELVNLGNFLS